MVTRSEWYARVNEQYPETMPIPTAEEASRAVRKLYRFATGEKLPWPIVITSGNRFTWRRGAKLNVNPDRQRGDGERGWEALIHDLSHWIHHKVNPGDKPHAKSHARLELRLIKEATRRGWLNSSLKPEVKIPAPAPSPADERAVKLAKIEARIARWERKRKRADNALKKLYRTRGSVQRAMATLH